MVFFLRGLYFFHFFHSFFLKILLSTNNNLKFPNGIYASGKGNIKLAYTCTSDQSGIWAMPCGPLPNSEICYEQELPTLKGYLLEIRKVSPKPYFILMTAFTLSVEYARFINIYIFFYSFIPNAVAHV